MSPTLRFLIFELRFNCEKVAAMSFFRFFIVFLVFGAFHFPLSNSFFKKKSVKLVLFSALAPRSSFRAGFGQEKLQSCQGTSIGFCKLVLANSIGVAASQLLCVATAHVLPLSFAARCLQIVLGWLHQCCSALLLHM
jgi:hypothetical protein